MTECAPVTTVTPCDDSRVELDSPVVSARIRIERDALASLLAGSGATESLEVELRKRGLLTDSPDNLLGKLEIDSISLWRSNNWSLSLSYYLWSRRTRFVDDGPDSAEQRTRTLRKMLDEEPCPEQLLPEIEPVLYLSEGRTRSGDMPLGGALLSRRSSFRPKGTMLRGVDLAFLLRQGAKKLMASRSASRQPDNVTNLLISFGSAIDVYVLLYKSADLSSGVYVLDPIESNLRPICIGDVRSEARSALLAHPEPSDAAATIVLVAHYPRYQWRYRHERAMRTLWIDAGRIMQDLVVCATSMGMKTGITPAVADDEFADLLGLNAAENQVLHTMTFSGVPEEV